MNKLQETGKESEGFTLRPEKEERLEIKEQVLAELA